MATPSKNSGVNKVLETEEDMSQYLDETLNLSDKSDAETAPSQSTPKNKAKGKSMLDKMKAAKNTNTGTPPAPRQAPAPAPPYQPAPGRGPPPSYHTVEGSNIGSQANEPDWTDEDLARINAACDVRLETVVVGETRRSNPDPQRKYLTITDDSKGTVITKPPAYLPNISTKEYRLGLGRGKPDQKVGKSRIYSDVIMMGSNVNFSLNQWTSMNVIMEGVPQNILDKPARTNASGKLERRIGHDFARVGLPKTSFGPMFETLRANMPGLFEDVSITRGYYWLNASWGVTSSPGTFIFKDENGMKGKTQRLYDAMKRIMGNSSMGVATIAISLSDEANIENGKMVASGNKYQFSIKLHNMFHLKNVPFHSPPQSSSTGFEISADIFDEAESLSAPSITSTVFSDTASSFTPGTINPFANINAMGGMGNNQSQNQPLL